MSIGILQPDQTHGLTPEQGAAANQLKENIENATSVLQNQELHRDDYHRFKERERIRGSNPHPLDVAGTLRLDEVTQSAVNVISHAVKKHNLNKAQRAAARHYNKHQGEYHTQALEEAKAEGVDVDFQGDIAQKVRKAS